MKRETLLWLIVLLIGAVLLAGRAFMSQNGMGKAYVKLIEETYVQLDDALIDAAAADDADADAEPGRSWVSIDDVPEGVDIDALPDEDVVSWNTYEKSDFAAFAAQPDGSGEIVFSLSHSIGIWVAALLTLFILSFLAGDNPLYKIAESMFIGISAAYWMVVGFWDTLVPNLFAKLAPGPTTHWALPGLIGEAKFDWVYVFPLILSIMLLMRLSPKGGWLSRWPMAFFIGTFCGFRLIAFLHGDFLAQIRNTIVSLYAKVPVVLEDGTIVQEFSFWTSVQNLILVIGVLACLVYFFFSFEHKGVVGGTARLGIWFLMITFGAAFAYTVMGRIALLAIRIEFLLDDWLWLIDPTGRRAIEATATLLLAPLGVVT